MNVLVPNTYTAGDEGKVVSSGVLVSQSSQNIDTNGTYDTTLKNSVNVNVSGGSLPANIVTGTFTGDAQGLLDISIPYSGNGFPIAVYIYALPYPSNPGQGNTAVLCLGKNRYTPYDPDNSTTKMFTGSAISYDSASSAYAVGTYTSLSMYGTKLLSTSRAIFLDDTTLEVRISSGNGNGFMKDVTYNYQIIYSE